MLNFPRSETSPPPSRSRSPVDSARSTKGDGATRSGSVPSNIGTNFTESNRSGSRTEESSRDLNTSTSTSKAQEQHEGADDNDHASEAGLAGGGKLSEISEPLFTTKPGECLVFEAAIQPETGIQVILGGESAEKKVFHGGPSNKLRLFEAAGERPWLATRRLCASISARSRTTVYKSFWLPLGDLRLVVEKEDVMQNENVVLTWSDCNQDFAHKPYDYEEVHDRVYERMEPNNTLLLKFIRREDALEFAAVLREPSQDLVRSQQKFQPIPLADGEMIAQPFEVDEGSASTKIIFVKSRNVLKLSTSRLYLVPKELDVVMPFRSPESTVSSTMHIRHIQVPTYISDKLELHRRDTSVGHCAEVRLEAVDSEWAFKNQAGMQLIDHQRLVRLIRKLIPSD